MRNLRKFMFSFFAFLLVFSNLQFVVGATGNEDAQSSNVDQVRELLKKEREAQKFEGLEQATFAANEKVRVIVEVSGETPLEYATKQKVLYKELAEKTKKSLLKDTLNKQKSVKDSISSKGINIKYLNSFTTAFNGFSGEVAFGDIEKIESLSEVTRVYLANEYNRPEVEPDMETSHQFIQSTKAWGDAHLKGEGMVVSVIDTGVDPDHQDFVISEDTEPYLTENNVNSIVSENSLKGNFFTEKVPYGYNYYDQNNQILDLGPGASHHGMHVAGTVAANGEIFGVAPEAQVLGMKVFSNDPNYPSTWSDVYLAAIDDSIKLGADVLNMSLGSTASFYDPASAEDLAITRAVENGIVCAVSAGNSGHFAYGYSNPFFQNPDIGVVGAPGLNKDTIQVAASGNEAYLYEHAISFGGHDFSAVGYGIDSWEGLEEVELVSLGKLGGPEDYVGVDVEGKVVVLPRGTHTFFDKTKFAAEAGAAGIIVYNHDPSALFFNNQGGWHIPFMKIQYAEGQALEQAIAAGNNTLKVEELERFEDIEFGRMTDFTSWGTTPSLELKPEITAPGGKIYSTLQNNEYGLMSGTSMAAPHVAGGSALVQQYLLNDERFDELNAEERTRLAKVLIMNTAKVIEDLNGQPFSPRRQGAGMMQIFSAVDTPVYVVNKDNGEGKVELFDFTNKTLSFTLVANNLTDEEVVYEVDTSVLTDTFKENGDLPEWNAEIAGDFEGAKVTAPETVAVPANGEKEFTITVDLTNAKIPGFKADGSETVKELVENIFVEGWVTLSHDIEADLVVPYLGFYGNWDNPAILDGLSVLDQDKFYNVLPADAVDSEGYFETFFTDENGENFYALNPDGDGLYDGINLVPAFLRNAREMQFNVLDEEGKMLRRILLQNDVRKSFYNAGRGTPYSYNDSRTWDGKVRSELVKDGKYWYEIKAVVDYANADYQSIKVPILVDTTAPEVSATYDTETGKVEWTAVDAGIGVEELYVFANDQLVGIFGAEETSTVLANPPAKALIEVYAVDKVLNIGGTTVTEGDTTEPLLFIGTSTPEPYGAYASLQVPVQGYATDDVAIDKITINGQAVPFTLNTANNRYEFQGSATFEKDGKFDVIVTAVDTAGNEFSISRKVFIDTTHPTITTDVKTFVDHDVTEVDATFTLADNYSYLSFYIDETHEYELPFRSPVDILEPASEIFKKKFKLEPGLNNFTLKLEDLAGNTVTEELSIYRNEADSRIDRLAGPGRYSTAAAISQAGWEQADVVVLARGDNYADALAGIPLAKKYDAPLLLTNTDSLNEYTKAEIERLGTKKVVILGAEAAVNVSVENELKDLGLEVQRLAGASRYSTAAAIAYELAPNGANEVVVVNGQNFPDALSVAAYAASKGMPILLTESKDLPKATKAALQGLGAKKSLVVGGTSVITPDVVVELPNPSRLNGENRFDTSVKVANHFHSGSNHYYVATGYDFADALAGAALAAKNNTGILLVGDQVPSYVETFVKANVDLITVFGGDNAVSAEVVAGLNNLLK
ncbi:cell wall-binding repeat-containing protein [Sutcliffiella halmapala]|uniref:cell wall-binding repeat-containing protein n=1 Tax=Sutcliffiella halmapala TaxID=79882 RepID=UPI001F238306|nr:cell wall-binding repeat-containing protein [Sutcliffiella halmapala]